MLIAQPRINLVDGLLGTLSFLVPHALCTFLLPPLSQSVRFFFFCRALQHASCGIYSTMEIRLFIGDKMGSRLSNNDLELLVVPTNWHR